MTKLLGMGRSRLALLVVSVLLAGYAALALTAGETVAAPISNPTYTADIHPVFAKGTNPCVSCHGDPALDPTHMLDDTALGFQLDTLLETRTTGAGGPMVKPGDAAGSLLWQIVNSGQMPLGGPKLSQDDIDTIFNWIQQGAKDRPAVTSRVRDAQQRDVTNGTVPLATTIHDEGTVTAPAGGAPPPTGGIVFHRFTSADCTGSSVDQGVSVGTPSAPFLTTAVGSLSYLVQYDGDSFYTPGTGPCEPVEVVATFGSLCTLSQMVVTNHGLATAMCSVLNAAEQAQAKKLTVAKTELLHAYEQLVQAAVLAHAVTPANAALLIAAAEQL